MAASTITERIGELCKALKGCEVSALVDYASGTVLASSSEYRVQQEELDRLCATAARLFSPAGDDGDVPEFVAILSRTSLTSLHRVERSTGEAVCLVSAPVADLAETVQRAKAVAAGIDD